ncbi:hypothetical protein HNY73_009149 [Argiope bruennichi]|uniref:Uncharacterized protein n=1 Tax=Argiope bruennichi TaxID=94029 RepID=A0A8T0F8P0_ARGBR|nr:hypothetical protein HNY73_009149 [Argiope bruennichi]
MESVMKWLVNLFPKANKVLCEAIDTPDAEDSLFKRYIHFFSKRILVIYLYIQLIFYKYAVYIIGHIAGRFLAKVQIIPYRIYKPNEKKEDPGVTEMHALLRGEDCFDYNLDQSQLRTSLPGDVDPYEEIYLVSYHYRQLIYIMHLLDSLKNHDELFAQTFNGLFSWFDKLVVGYLKSEDLMNKRD